MIWRSNASTRLRFLFCSRLSRFMASLSCAAHPGHQCPWQGEIKEEGHFRMCLRLGLVLVKRREEPAKHSPRRFGLFSACFDVQGRRPAAQTPVSWPNLSKNVVTHELWRRHHDARDGDAAGVRSVGERRFGWETRQDCRGAQWQPRARRCRCAAKSVRTLSLSGHFSACGAAPKRS